MNISLEKWKQIIAEGQDQKITIEKRFLCFPFGHRIIYVKDTNRKIHFQDGAFYAVEKTTYRIVVRQRTVNYVRMRLDDPSQDRSFQLPFRTLTITDRVVPNLDEPNYISDLKKNPPCLDAFWPTRCGKLLELNFEGICWAGNVVKKSSPVLLVQDTAIPDHVPAISSEYRKPSVEPARSDNPPRRDLAGQLVALAPSFQKGDTEVAALRADFDGLPQNLAFGSDFCPAPGEIISEEIDLPDLTIAPDESHLIVDFGKRHEFPTTKHYAVIYQMVATTCYREYYDSKFTANQDNITIKSERSKLIHILNTVAPPVPEVVYVLPIFIWEDAIPVSSEAARNGETITRKVRRGLRVYMRRNWCASGDDERLAVVFAPKGASDARALEADPDNQVPVTQWGTNPIWYTTPAKRQPTVDDASVESDMRFEGIEIAKHSLSAALAAQRDVAAAAGVEPLERPRIFPSTASGKPTSKWSCPRKKL